MPHAGLGTQAAWEAKPRKSTRANFSPKANLRWVPKERAEEPHRHWPQPSCHEPRGAKAGDADPRCRLAWEACGASGAH